MRLVPGNILGEIMLAYGRCTKFDFDAMFFVYLKPHSTNVSKRYETKRWPNFLPSEDVLKVSSAYYWCFPYFRP